VEDRRRNDDIRLDEMMKLITDNTSEARAYRSVDAERQLNLISDITEIKAQVKKTNGRVNDLEDKQKVSDEISAYRKDNANKMRDFISVVTTVAIGIVAIFEFIMHILRNPK